MKRVHNFFPGPGALPLEAIEYAQKELVDFQGKGLSLLEMSHRTPEYESIHDEATSLVKDLLKVPENYHVLWLQGGASLQFATIPMNLVRQGESADYIDTGIWSTRAITEANIVAKANVAGSSEDKGFKYLPKNPDFDPQAKYVWYTSNNTIMGTQYFDPPDTGDVPLVADMSSDIFWRYFDISKHGIVFAGAHKNLGPSGITLVLLRDDLLKKCKKGLPTLLSYSTHVEHNSMFNTPQTFTIYFVRNVLWMMKDNGGLAPIEQRNRKKGKLFYDFVDNSGGFYTNDIQVEDRSVMNAVFSLPSEELEERFLAEAAENDFIGLKNLPDRGHCRVSMYNAVSVESVEELLGFMKEFMRKNG